MKTQNSPLSIASELVRLWDAGIRPQIVRGMHREEQEFAQLVREAREMLTAHDAQMRSEMLGGVPR